MNKLKSSLTINFLPWLIICITFILSGCAAPTSGTGTGRVLTLDPDYKYKIEKINISEEKKYEIDAKEMLRSALEKALGDKDLLWGSTTGENYYGLHLRIIDYDMGNAFKRWLLPTYGSTILSVHTDVIDLRNNEIISYMEHKQTIAAGGLYTVGAWKYVFDIVAKDIAIDLERKFSGSGKGFFISLNPWLEEETEPPESIGTQNIQILPFQDARPEKNRIGERHAAFNVSMGDIFANRDVLTYVREAVQNELLASGNTLFDDENYDITLSGHLMKFWVWTDTTPLYWDIIGEIELKLTVMSKLRKEAMENTYKAKSKCRTYVWPTEKLVTSVVSDTIKTLMYDIRKDRIWITP